MPRDLNGNYSLPAGNPVSPNTVIEADWANTTMQDIAAALTNSLSRTGDGGMLAPFLFADGNSLVPSISWTNQPTAGWYRAGVSDFRYVINAVDIVQLTATKVHLFPNAAAANVLVGKIGSNPAVRQAIQILENGFSPPSADGLNADGDKFVFWNASGIKLGIGLESGGFFYQASGPGITAGHNWYGGSAAPAKQMQLEVNGNLVVGGISPPPSGGFVGFRASGPVGGFIDFFTGAVRRSVVYADATYELRIEGVGPLGIALGAIGTPAVVVDTALAATQPIGFKGGHAGASAIANLPHGAGNPAPVNGDMWTTSAGLFVRINGVTIGPLNGTPAGAIMWFHAAPDASWLRLNGQTVAKATYPALWTHAQGFLTADQVVNPGLYKDIDATNFAVPKLDGLFIRAQGQVDGNHISAALGVKQADTVVSHEHTGGRDGSAAGVGPGWGAGVTTVLSALANTGFTGSSEGRPVNVALVPCVKAF